LGELQATLARDQLAMLNKRNDVWASMDKLIINRKFGEFGGRKTVVGGLEFDG